MTKYYFIFLFLFALHSAGLGQNIPTIPEDRGSGVQSPNNPNDSTTIVDNTFFDIFTGNPGKAAFYSLIFPGGGQIYNRKWWKLPIVYGAEGYLVYSIITNTTEYNGYQNAYLDQLDGNTEANYRGITDVTVLRSRRNSFRKAREYAWVFFIGGRLISIFEAFIDRHLMEFDVSDDLTFTPIITEIGTFNGITYTIPLNKKKKKNIFYHQVY
ncbi:MAG: DUF5683 domain-containing protein [Bacteroidota bacterium]